jgi:hypothetical protein
MEEQGEKRYSSCQSEKNVVDSTKTNFDGSREQQPPKKVVFRF